MSTFENVVRRKSKYIGIIRENTRCNAAGILSIILAEHIHHYPLKIMWHVRDMRRDWYQARQIANTKFRFFEHDACLKGANMCNCAFSALPLRFHNPPNRLIGRLIVPHHGVKWHPVNWVEWMECIMLLKVHIRRLLLNPYTHSLLVSASIDAYALHTFETIQVMVGER